MIHRALKERHRSRRHIEQGYNGTELDTRISELCLPLFSLCEYAIRYRTGLPGTYSRILIHLHTESTTIEELVDNYGAQHNEKWYPFREAVAAVKLFSSVCYNVLHVKDALARYSLIEVKGKFYEDTDSSLDLLMDAVASASKTLIFQAKQCGIFHFGNRPKLDLNEPAPPDLRFPADRKTRHVQKTGKTVVYVSTAFLNLSKDRDVASVLKERDTDDYSQCIPEAVNEKNIRLAESRFHNLQSHYDTYIFESDIEHSNRNLPVLRGHISAIFHLLQVATELAHYYERHMSELRRKMTGELRFPLSKQALLKILFEYLLGYSKKYMDSATNLCRAMIQSYSERREIRVPIPNYRGFHVRPSTLIAKIVAHYGSSVTMVLDTEEYNAGIVFDLFRANEKINALKRRRIGYTLEKCIDPERLAECPVEGFKKKLQMLFLELANEHRIILYDTNLPFDELETSEDETMLNFVTRYVRHYMSISKIDVESDLTAIFKGDNRALLDIKLLAEHGYGEDRFGNNIVLPEELSYLRR